MTERPIIFNGEMVRAILDGRKTQTRRVVRICGGPEGHEAYQYIEPPRTRSNYHDDWRFWYYWGPETPSDYVKCPYGKPGDTLWVREAHTFTSATVKQDEFTMHTMYTADGTMGYINVYDHLDWFEKFSNFNKHRPSIHMPRWAARLFLRVKAVRVERIQDISVSDIIAEGVIAPDQTCYGDEFVHLWDSINAKRGYAWADNPWVWVIEFEVRE